MFVAAYLPGFTSDEAEQFIRIAMPNIEHVVSRSVDTCTQFLTAKQNAYFPPHPLLPHPPQMGFVGGHCQAPTFPQVARHLPFMPTAAVHPAPVQPAPVVAAPPQLPMYNQLHPLHRPEYSAAPIHHTYTMAPSLPANTAQNTFRAPFSSYNINGNVTANTFNGMINHGAQQTTDTQNSANAVVPVERNDVEIMEVENGAVRAEENEVVAEIPVIEINDEEDQKVEASVEVIEILDDDNDVSNEDNVVPMEANDVFNSTGPVQPENDVVVIDQDNETGRKHEDQMANVQNDVIVIEANDAPDVGVDNEENQHEKNDENGEKNEADKEKADAEEDEEDANVQILRTIRRSLRLSEIKQACRRNSVDKRKKIGKLTLKKK